MKRKVKITNVDKRPQAVTYENRAEYLMTGRIENRRVPERDLDRFDRGKGVRRRRGHVVADQGNKVSPDPRQ